MESQDSTGEKPTLIKSEQAVKVSAVYTKKYTKKSKSYTRYTKKKYTKAAYRTKVKRKYRSKASYRTTTGKAYTRAAGSRHGPVRLS